MVKEEHKKWYSPNLMLKSTCSSLVTVVSLFYCSQQAWGDISKTKTLKLIDSVEGFINEGKIKIYCPDGIDKLSWYNKSIHPADRVKNHIWYDKYLLEEVAPLARHETGYSKIITAGCSFGGYHAANFAFRHPWLVSHMLA
jgi:esterase/lipase superfamily enzyme